MTQDDTIGLDGVSSVLSISFSARPRRDASDVKLLNLIFPWSHYYFGLVSKICYVAVVRMRVTDGYYVGRRMANGKSQGTRKGVCNEGDVTATETETSVS